MSHEADELKRYNRVMIIVDGDIKEVIISESVEDFMARNKDLDIMLKAVFYDLPEEEYLELLPHNASSANEVLLLDRDVPDEQQDGITSFVDFNFWFLVRNRLMSMTPFALEEFINVMCRVGCEYMDADSDYSFEVNFSARKEVEKELSLNPRKALS
ncbi:hypothetical protein ACFL2R_00520 [Patescibacteria group bacterium]